MSYIISTSDFVGRYAIVTGTNEAALIQEDIDNIETTWMRNLLGVTEGDAFILECSLNVGVPTSPQYLVIYEYLQLEEVYCNNEFEYVSGGIKEMLKGVVYNQYYTQKKTVPSVIGKQVIEGSNAVSSPSLFELKRYYNQSINNYRVIQKYIERNRADFPDYKGLNKNYTTPF